jgi:hypothetical protein
LAGELDLEPQPGCRGEGVDGRRCLTAAVWLGDASPTLAVLVRVEIDSPVPVELELVPGKLERMPSGTHRVPRHDEGMQRDV